jgi:hypothetical protein
MVSMKIVASETAFPIICTDQVFMRDRNWIILQFGFLMTIEAIGGLGDGHALTGMFKMTCGAKLWLDVLPSLCKPGFEESKHWVPIIGSFVAVKASRIGDFLMAKTHRRST